MTEQPLAPSERRVAIIGLGYVGLPVAVAFAREGSPVVGFDIDKVRVEELRNGHDRTLEIESQDLKLAGLSFTDALEDLKACNFFVVTVPTPINAAKQPDLRALIGASRTIGQVLKRGDIVVYESTVYPGATEEDCMPILEAVSGLKGGEDFFLGYSPERINPGDKLHRLDTVTKVVAGQTPETLEIIAREYARIAKAGVHRAPSIKVAEAAKVIENTQRDINIAMMNELSHIFHRMDVDIGDVLEAAGTKWNFLRFEPGLVGGHCIGVDPYYLTHKAERLGYHPQMILAGRRINDSMGEFVAAECIRLLLSRGIAQPKVALLGLTFKENVPDLRESKAAQIHDELKRFGVGVSVSDPFARADDAEHEYGIALTPLDKVRDQDAVILAVAHRAFIEGGWPVIRSLLKGGKGVVIDVKRILDRESVPEGITLWRL